MCQHQPATGKHRHVHLPALLALVALGAILLPVGVEAATGNAVNITDPDRAGRKATVTPAGRLRTSVCDENGCAQVDDGKLRIGDGAGVLNVSARTGLPTDPEHVVLTVTEGSSNRVLFPFGSTYAKGTTMGLSTLTFSNTGSASAQVVVGVPYDGCASESFFDPVVTWVVVPVGETVTQSFPTPIVLGSPGDFAWCVRVKIQNPTSGSEVQVTAVGFLI